MQPTIKIVVAILAVVLVVVIGLIVLSSVSDKSTGEPAAMATVEPGTSDAPQTEAPADGAQQAQEEEAQGTMYEGALAGLTEEEIAALAIAEEQSSARLDNSGAEDAVD